MILNVYQNILKKYNNYVLLLVFHILLGVSIYKFSFLSKILTFLIVIIGIYCVVKNKNKNYENLVFAAYFVGIEVFLKATHANPIYEFGKVIISLFMFLGIYYNGISKKSYPYFIYALLLIPSVVIAVDSLLDLKRKIGFDISGPICLAICSIYTFDKKITKQHLDKILLAIGLPVVTFCSYLFFKSPIKYIDKRCTESNFNLSANYAPNQVTTILGLGLIVFFVRTIINSKNNKLVFINIAISSYILYRGLLTFSRGGVIAAFIIIFVFVFFLFLFKKLENKKNLLYLFVSFLIVISITNYQTNGLLITRYENKNVLGSKNYNAKIGREALAKSEIDFFKEKPLLGIGIGNGKEKRIKELGYKVASHNEITRMIGEHGVLGIIGLLILFTYPAINYLKNKKNFYIVCFFLFWLLTINHSAMRIAAPAFLYALSLLKINFEED